MLTTVGNTYPLWFADLHFFFDRLRQKPSDGLKLIFQPSADVRVRVTEAVIRVRVRNPALSEVIRITAHNQQLHDLLPSGRRYAARFALLGRGHLAVATVDAALGWAASWTWHSPLRLRSAL